MADVDGVEGGAEVESADEVDAQGFLQLRARPSCKPMVIELARRLQCTRYEVVEAALEAFLRATENERVETPQERLARLVGRGS